MSSLSCITLLIHFAVRGVLHRDLLLMDFIPINCELSNGKNRFQTGVEYCSDVKKKRLVEDDNQVSILVKLVNFCSESVSGSFLPLDSGVICISFVCKCSVRMFK